MRKKTAQVDYALALIRDQHNDAAKYTYARCCGGGHVTQIQALTPVISHHMHHVPQDCLKYPIDSHPGTSHYKYAGAQYDHLRMHLSVYLS